jgi:hypothetical protein
VSCLTFRLGRAVTAGNNAACEGCGGRRPIFFALKAEFVLRFIQYALALSATDSAQETRDTIPQEYHQYADVFSEQDSNTLPPRRGSTDHRILLEEGMSPGYCPLYKQSEEELREAKAYITRNLAQGFIVPSKAPFASPILMVRKPSGGLRFCVDYRKLNALTKKDRYPLPLIDEILQRLSKAKIFTKLDIRQGFHRIRMYPDSEDLTTFRTRYGSFKY